VKLFLLIFLTAVAARAEYSYELEAVLRTDPRAMNMTAKLNYDLLLRGGAAPENPLYSYARVGLIAGGSPTLGAFVEYAPIAPLVFSVQKNRTHRFLDASRFDCETNQCKKNIDRTDYGVRAALAYQNIFFSQSYTLRELQTDADSLPIYIEQEQGVVSSGFHRYQEATSILGYRISLEQIAGALYTGTWLSEGGWRSHTASVFFRQQCGEFSLTFGLSQYKYDQFDVQGPAGFITLNFSQGEKLSLF